VPRTLALSALAVGVIAVLIVIGGPFSSGGDHIIRAPFASVEQLTPGLEVRIAGRKVGSIDSIKLAHGGHPVVSMQITEGDVWPLPAGTTAQARWGSTTSLAYRYVELHPGKASAAGLPNRALLAEAKTSTPVELDQYYRIFRGRTTGDVRKLVGELGDTVATKGGAQKRGLAGAPGGLNQTSAVLAELGASRQALDSLVLEGNRVSGALAGKQSNLGSLVDHLAATFDEFGRNTQAEQASLEQGPQALSTARATLARLDASVPGLQGLVDDIAPGAAQLQKLAPRLRTALLELNRVGPLAASTLQKGTRAAAPLGRLVDTGIPFIPRLGSTLAQLDPMFACLRPYTPELAGNLGTWTGYNQNYDAGGHYARTFDLQLNPLIIAGTPFNAKQIVQTSRAALTYAMPRPPGLNAGHPWFQPQCGAGPDSLNASKDPEASGP
jgi:phospholipid/cholesterol/gamma-HCH transport system substrate-binding protein